MPSKPFSSLLTDPRFKALPEEEQSGLVNRYWDKFAADSPDNAEFADSQKKAGIGLLEMSKRYRDATPTEKRLYELPIRDAITSISLNEDRLYGKIDDTTHRAKLDEYKKSREAMAEDRDAVASWFDPKVQDSVSPLLTQLGKLALEGDKFGTAGTLQKGADLAVRAATLGRTSPKKEASESYDAFRDQIATQFKLSSDEVDDVVKHRMGLQKNPVSRDALGQIHIKDETLAKPLPEIQKEIEQADLPAAVKSRLTSEVPQRVAAFKAGVLTDTMKNHPELAKSLGFTKPPESIEEVDQMYATLNNELNNTVASQFVGGVAAAGGRSIFTVPTVSSITGSTLDSYTQQKESAAARGELAAKLESVNQLSNQINKDKVSIFGTGADVIGQGVFSGVESLLVAGATGGLGTSLMTPTRSVVMATRFGKLGELAASGVKSAGDIAPLAFIYGTQQGVSSYEAARKAGMDQGSSLRAGVLSGLIEGGIATAMSFIGLGGTERAAATLLERSGQEAVKKSIRQAWLSAGGKTALGISGEEVEEFGIAYFDQLAVQTRINPEMTLNDVQKALKDTVLATLAVAGPLSTISATGEEGTNLFRSKLEKPISELTDEQLEIRANATAIKTTTQENIPEEVLGSRNVTPPRPEDVAGLREELATLTAKRLPPGSPSFRERGRRVAMIEEQLSAYEAQKETPEEKSLSLREVPTDKETPANAVASEGDALRTGTTEAPTEAAQDAVEVAPLPPTEIAPAKPDSTPKKWTAETPSPPTTDELLKAPELVVADETPSPPTMAPEPVTTTTDEKESQGSESQAEKVLTENATGEESPVVAPGKPLKAIHYSREPLKLQKSKDIGSIEGRYEEESTFGEGFYAMEPQDEPMWTGMNRFSLGENRNEVTITPSNPLVITPETGKTLNVDKALKDIEDGVYDAVVIRGFSEEVSSQIYDRVNELWHPKFPEGKTSGKFINTKEYDAALEQATEELTGISGKQYQKLFDAGMTQNQIFIPKDAAPDIVSTNENQKQKASRTTPVESKPADQSATGKTEAGTTQRKSEGQEVISAPTKGKPTGALPEGQPTSGDVGKPPSPTTVLDLVASLMGVKNVAPQEEMLFDENGQRRLFQQSPQDKDQGNPAAKKFVASFKGSPPKNATRILLDYVGNQLLTSTADLPKAIQRDISEGNKLYERFTKVSKGKPAKVKVGRVNFNNFLSALWERKNKGKPVGWANQREPKYVRDNARTLAFEAAHALSKEGSGLDWYNYKIEAMFAELAKTYPELAEDGQERFLFSIILAVTSNGQDIVSNLADTIVNYNEMRGKDTLPEKITMSRTTRLAAAQRSINTINDMLKTRTWKELKKELLTKTTAGQIEKTYGKKVTGEATDEPMLNAMLLGPKIGAYWANLNGNFDPITMDMWFVRTLNRVAGDLTTVDPDKLLKVLDRLEKLDLPKEVQEDIKDYRKAVSEEEDWVSVPADIREDLPALYNFTKDTLNKYSREGFTDRNALNLTAQDFVERLDGSNSAPDNSTHRKWMREVLGETRKILKRNGIEITNADLQAVLWFHEKDIYTKFGATSAKGQREDYETGVLPAMRLAQSRMSQTGKAVPSTVVKAESGDMFGGMEFAAKPAEKTDFQGRKLFQQSKEDAEYLAAVERGDMETAQRMVDEAAKVAGYDVGPVWHGTRSNDRPIVFDTNRQGQLTGNDLPGTYFTDSETYARAAKGGPLYSSEGTHPYYLKFKNLATGRDETYASYLADDQAGPVDRKTEYRGDDKRKYLIRKRNGIETRRRLEMSGFDGVHREIAIADEWIAFSPSQIKSADPVTYDAQGNIIPLSQRFNPESPSILYQGPKGSFQLKGLSEAIIEFFKTADPSTAIHEFAHAVRGFFLDKGVPAENRYGVTDEDIDTVTNWATDGTGEWDTKAEEKWARGIERFFWEGISTGVKAVDDVLAKLSKWMRDVYQSIKGSDIDIEISPEVRAVMEKLVKRGETLKAEGKAPTPVKIAVKTYTPPAPKKKQMVPSEVFSPKNEVTEAQLAKFGLADRTDPDTRVNDEVLQEAMAQLREDDTAGATLITKLEESGRIATDTELAILMHEAIKAETNAVKLYNAVVKGDTESRTPYEMARIRYEQILRLLQNQGTKAARALAFRRILLNRRMDVVKLKEAIRTAKAYGSKSDSLPSLEGKDLERTENFAELYKELEEKYNKVLAEKRADDAAKLRDAVIGAVAEEVKPKTTRERVVKEATESLKWLKDNAVSFGRKLFQLPFEGSKKKLERLSATLPKELQLNTAPYVITNLDTGETRTQNTPVQASDIPPTWEGANISITRGEGNTLYQQPSDPLSDLDPEAVKHLVTYAKAFDTLKAFTASLTKEFGEEAAPYAQALFDKAQQKIKKAARSPKEVRDSIDANEDISGTDVYNMVKGYLTIGVPEDEVLERVHQDLQQVWPDISIDDVIDAFTGYGKVKFPSQEEIETKIRHLRQVSLIERQIGELKRGRVPKKTGQQRDPKDEEIRALEKEAKNLYKLLNITRDNEGELKSPLESIKSRFKNEIADRKAAIAARKPLPDKTPPTPYDEETKKLQAQLEEVRKQYDAVFADPAATEAQQLNRAIAGLDRLIEKEEQMLADGILKNPPRADKTFTDPEYLARKQKLADMRKARADAYLILNPKKSRAEVLHDAALAAQKRGLARDRQIVATGKLVVRRVSPLAYTPSAELQAVLAERDALGDLIDEMKKNARAAATAARKPQRDAAKLTRDIANAAKSLAKLDQQILDLQTTGTLPTRRTRTGTTNPVLKAIRDARKDRVKTLAALERAAKQTKSPRELLEERRIAALAKREQELKDMMARGQYLKIKKTPEPLNERELLAKVKLEQVERDFEKFRQEKMLENATRTQKILRGAWGAYRFARMLKLMGNFVTLLQGGPHTYRKLTSGQWKSLARQIKDMAKAGISDEQAAVEYEKLVQKLDDVGFPAKHLRLLAPFETTTLSKEDIPDMEIFETLAKWDPSIKALGKVNVFKAIRKLELMNQGYLNQARVDTVMLMLSWAPTRIPTEDEMKKIAAVAEVVTGRGQLYDKLERATPFINDFFLNSVRWTVSQFQHALGYPVWKAPKGMKLKAFDQLWLRPNIGRIALGVITSMLMGATGDDEDEEERKRQLKRWWDIRESSFGKVPLPRGGSLDLSQGAGAALHLLSNILFGYEIRRGEKIKLRNTWVWGDGGELEGKPVTFRGDLEEKTIYFIMNRLNVTTAAIARNFIWREKFGGGDPTFLSTMNDLVGPIIAKDTYEIFKLYGLRGTLVWLEALQGSGFNEPRPKKPEKRASNDTILGSVFPTTPSRRKTDIFEPVSDKPKKRSAVDLFR